MAERISNLTSTVGAPAKYPWAQWTDGSAWRITQGTDFEVPTASMSAIIRAHARRHGLFVGTRRTGDVIEFQFLRPAQEKAA